MTEEKKSGRRRLVGTVVSDKMDKTITVRVERRVQHARYRKYITQHKTYKAHDEGNSCQVDDVVVIEESRPLSKHKRWVLIEKR
ncbi:MAG: 30S ribosomal protein S17 [Alphaproteobacteria bacterium]|nr:30S ribosomal protein S17 [Alphaproteobacteria bacterium]